MSMTTITIELHDGNYQSCPPGRYATQMKTSREDKQFIAEAASLVGMTQAQFLRAVIFQVACAIHDPASQGNYGQDARLPDRSA